jgi:hypothetical protein
MILSPERAISGQPSASSETWFYRKGREGRKGEMNQLRDSHSKEMQTDALTNFYFDFLLCVLCNRCGKPCLADS